MAAVMFAVFLTVLMRGMQLGTYERNIQLTVEMFTSYIQVQVDGYFENPTLRKTFVYSDKIKKRYLIFFYSLIHPLPFNEKTKNQNKKA